METEEISDNHAAHLERLIQRLPTDEWLVWWEYQGLQGASLDQT